ncbi:MAG: hypothetical protein LUF04_15220 [Bacteroides sp.]|nr:hypothetical protein [Bacteroides sp.]
MGNLKFSDKTPEMGNGFTTIRAVEEYGADEYVSYIVNNSDNEMVVQYYPGETMQVYSPEFYTEEGLRVGMTLQEALETLKGKKITVLYENPYAAFLFQYANEFVFEINGADLKGGGAAFDQWYLKGGDTPKIEDFQPEAKIQSIRVRKR